MKIAALYRDTPSRDKQILVLTSKRKNLICPIKNVVSLSHENLQQDNQNQLRQEIWKTLYQKYQDYCV
jgi:hypothetical protein